jgi:hypothetical protein
MGSVKFTREDIIKHTGPDIYTMTIQEMVSSFPADFTWGHINSYSEDQQQKFWSLRRLLFYTILAHVHEQLTNGKTHRCLPEGFATEQYTLFMFGSEKLTSDIDATVEGPHASFLIASLEDAWLSLTGSPCGRWDVEYYGDFLMFLDEQGEKSYLNSREFDDSTTKILPFVGVSILKNTGKFDFPLLENFLQSHSELQDGDWQSKAHSYYDALQGMQYDARREKYYTLLGQAEEMRLSQIRPTKEAHLAVFLLLCEANIYRSENYILPSTVIHVVRGLQAKEAKPSRSDPTCRPYHVRVATCNLDKTAYLFSALEQLGFMERFLLDEAKFQKYQQRYLNAMIEFDKDRAMAGGARSRRKHMTKRRRIHKKRSTRARK